MKLYHIPGTASLAARIVLAEAGIDYEAVQVGLRSKRTPDGCDFLLVNPTGYVPVLELDAGTRITECAAILRYVADMLPGSGLAPPAGTIERVQVQEWLSFVGSEVHKQFSPLFTPGVGGEWRSACLAKLGTRLGWIDGQLAGRAWLVSDRMTIADAHLFAIVNWVGWVPELELGEWPGLSAFHALMCARTAIEAAMECDGLPRSRRRSGVRLIRKQRAASRGGRRSGSRRLTFEWRLLRP